MTESPFGRSAAQTAGTQVTFDEGLRRHMLRVYNYMAVGLGVTGLIAMLVASTPALYGVFFAEAGKPTLLGILAMLAPLGFVFFMSFKANSVSAARLQTLFWAFCAIMGLSMANIFAVFTADSIARVFFITGATFAGASLWGYTTKRDLTGFGSFLFMGLIGIIIASVVNIFLGSSMLQFIVSIAGVLIFTGLTAWDSQQIKESYAESWGAEANQKLAVMGALSLYLNFINLFQMLLSLMGNRE